MEPGPTLLPLDRVADNRRRSRRLVALFALIAFPSIAYVGQYVAFVFLLWMVPLFGGLGWAAFLTLDFLLVIALMVVAFRWLHASAADRLLRAVNAQRLADNDEPDFRRLAQNMSIASGLPLPALFVIEEPAPNLLAIGLTRDDAALVATSGLLRALDRRELEGALAHAFAQIGNGDTRLDTLLAAGVRFLKIPANFVLWACRGLGHVAARFGLLGWGCLVLVSAWLLVPLALSVVWGLTDPDFWWICWIALAFLIYIFLLGPGLAALAARRIARERKHLADAEAVQLTRLPVGLARALAKVDAAGSAYAGAPPEAANLYLADPIAAGSGWWDRIVDSHPAVAERIAMVSRLGGTVPPTEIEDAAREGASLRAKAAAKPPVAPLLEPASATRPPAMPNHIQLLEDAPLLASSRAGSEDRGTVRSGTRVTVLGETADFVEVVTPDDRIGWVSKLARTTASDMSHSPEGET